MEAVEDTNLEAAIGWLADTILANLPAGGKLESWIHQAGLGNDIGRLKSEVEAVEMVVSTVQGRAAGNKPLTKSLARVKELLYNADDVVDELDCYRLQQELQPETLLETDGHGMRQTVERCRENADDVQSSSNGRLRSKEWIHFEITEFEQNGGPAKARCKHCEKVVMCTTKMGTSVLRNHLNSKGCSHKRGANEHLRTTDATRIPTPVATGDSSSRKRMRTSEESTHIATANPNRWNKDTFPERIQDITSQLQVKREAVTKLLKILGSDSGGASSNHCQSTISDTRRRTSSLIQGKVYGRATEKRSIKKLIEEHKSTTTVTVPIIGIGGVGKAALAQLVYNDPALGSQFDHKIWIWVSNNFDEMIVTIEMLDCVSQEMHDGLCSFPKLQEVLKGHIKSKRVLLILDDVWEDMDDSRWNKLLTPFKSGGANGNMIIITTRKLSIANRRGTIRPIKLGALRKDDFLLLFKASAIGY
ncbi:disease resistance RPP13-like protein 4 [Triticum urartu]|uniref:disease resistance RPP13-like protein 4 n=1 Tax=Triticum urartu TaxID=4572 RepID=UPI002042BE69|nr:disease resistance RPP13-like protein 4 [Triticum urartu]